MSVTQDQVLQALKRVIYPGFSRDIVSLGVVRNLHVDGDRVRFEIDVAPGHSAVSEPIRQAARDALEKLEGVREAEIRVVPTSSDSPSLKMAGSTPSDGRPGAHENDLIPDVRQVIAVASGKGGVGKSTVAVNLAVSLARSGRRVGLLDADIYGPSIPLMMGVQDQPKLSPDKKLLPFERFGVSVMSLGFLVDPDAAVIWRGPMVMKALEQMLRDVAWGPLDVMVIDLPPGTGDAQLTISQRVSLAGAVIVTTPQDVALADARKGVAMFRKVDVPILGIVENMSFFECPACSHRSEIFGHGGGLREAERLGVECLGQIPLDAAIRGAGDSGAPIVHAEPQSTQAEAFSAVGGRILELLDIKSSAGQESGDGSVFERSRKVWGGPRK